MPNVQSRHPLIAVNLDLDVWALTPDSSPVPPPQYKDGREQMKKP